MLVPQITHQQQVHKSMIKSMFNRLRPVLEGFVVTVHEGAYETGSQIPRDLTHCLHKPKCIVTTNPGRLVLITIITWQFQFHPMNVSILCLKYKFRVRSESRFICYPPCYIIRCPLTMGIVASQYPASRDAALMTCYLTALILMCLKPLKIILPQWNIFTTNLQTSMKIVMLLLTPMIGGINQKLCQWSAWRIWCHALTLVTHKITCHQAYVA